MTGVTGLREEKKVKGEEEKEEKKEEKENCCGTGGNQRLYMRSSRKTCKFWVCCEGGDKY